MKFTKLVTIVSLIFVSLANSYEFNESFQNDEDVTTDEYEVKYVNSGQSVLLVCDLPNSMPDGQVRSVLFQSPKHSIHSNAINIKTKQANMYF